MKWQYVRGDFFELYLSMLRMQKTLCRQTERSALSLAASHINALIIIGLRQPINMSRLAEEMLISRQQMTGVVDLLVKKGLVSRREDGANRRITLLELTPPGQRVVEQFDGWVTESVGGGQMESDQLSEAFSTVKRLMTASIINDK